VLQQVLARLQRAFPREFTDVQRDSDAIGVHHPVMADAEDNIVLVERGPGEHRRRIEPDFPRELIDRVAADLGHFQRLHQIFVVEQVALLLHW
jgi:hypothetical protein